MYEKVEYIIYIYIQYSLAIRKMFDMHENT